MPNARNQPNGEHWSYGHSIRRLAVLAVPAISSRCLLGHTRRVPRAILALALLTCVASRAQVPVGLQAISNETVLHALLRLGKQSQTPLGIVRSNDGLLCRPLAGTFLIQPADVAATVERVATEAGYETVSVDGTTIVRPFALSDLLYRTMSYRFETFPAITNKTMATMGTTLQGWLEVEVNHASAYVTENAYGSDAEMLTLTNSSALDTLQLATKIINLGSKGVWILSETARAADQRPALRLEAYSYKDDWRALDSISCPTALK